MKDNCYLYNSKFDFVSNGYTFNPEITKKCDFSAMQKKYIDSHLPGLSEESRKSISNIKSQLLKINKNNHLSAKTMVVIPIFVLESDFKIKSLIKQLQKQKGNFKVLMYINGYKKSDDGKSSGITKKTITDKIGKIKKYADNKFYLVGNLYDKAQLMGSFASDMKDALLLSYNNKIDPIIIRMDADVYHLPKGYIQGIVEGFENDKNLSYINSKIYCTKPQKHKFVRLSELVSDIGGYWNQKNTSEVPTYGSGMSFRGSDWLKIKGSQRDISRMEDYVIAWKITQYYGSLGNPDYSRGKWNDKPIYCNPRRQITNLLSGRFYHENTYEFNFINEKEIDFGILEPYNAAVDKLINRQYVSLRELNLLEDYINLFSTKLTNISQIFQDYWNNNMKNKSLYCVVTNNKNLIEFTENSL